MPSETEGFFLPRLVAEVRVGLDRELLAHLRAHPAEAPEDMQPLLRGPDPDTPGEPASPPLFAGPAPALVDKGATHTLVDLELIRELRLPATGEMAVRSVNTGAAEEIRTTYLASLVVSLRGTTIYEADFIEVVGCDFGRGPFQAVIGFDILSKCLLFLDGPRGRFTLAH